MSWLLRWLKRATLLVLLLVVALASPIIYVETACQGTALAEGYDPLLPAADHRSEARTLLTYPEWHIVHAYEDYARVIETDDPHDYGYAQSIRGFWSSLCAVTQQASEHGGVDTATKQMVYVIGVSFSAELALKAAYEETFGRLASMVRGASPSPSDTLSARQAKDYAEFLQQTPWYKWDFRKDKDDLNNVQAASFRDTERKISLGLEYSAKAAYAGIIASAVDGVGADELTLRMVVSGADETWLHSQSNVQVIQTTQQGTVIQTPRYRELTHLLNAMANAGADFVEIAGNDDILLTAISDEPTNDLAFVSMQRQGFKDYRHLILVKVGVLAQTLRELEQNDLQLEHIHDY